ncbi:NAD(P)-dependent oxidoreductase [Mycobacterium sp. RTGN5]|uniref:NAD-dependent epimerase/dehydratase family protein n=1 Tax=Mycobacterium sp. RTGN5 TaxID=3016522 RepID=UPI0029C901C5|nr:NAD(P)-dependent oxidoreductase [Mycobacterium sp. RTGN5]
MSELAAPVAVVIGSSGFLGRALVDELCSRGRSVVACDRKRPDHGEHDNVRPVIIDITDRASLDAVVDGADEVYHLAGQLGTSELDDQLHQSITTNIIGSLNVFEAAIAQHVPRVFFASKVHIWLNAYTITKHAAEQIGRLLSQQHPTRICSLRYLNLFGPAQKLYPVRKVLPTFAIQAMRGLPIQVFGDGEQLIDMLYVGDAARITVDFLDVGFVDHAVDCGSGVAMSVNELAERTNAYFGNMAGIQHVPMRKGEVRTTRQAVAEPHTLEKLLGPTQLTDWDVAFGTTLAWYGALDSHTVDAALSFHGLAHPFDGTWSP